MVFSKLHLTYKKLLQEFRNWNNSCQCHIFCHGSTVSVSHGKSGKMERVREKLGNFKSMTLPISKSIQTNNKDLHLVVIKLIINIRYSVHAIPICTASLGWECTIYCKTCWNFYQHYSSTSKPLMEENTKKTRHRVLQTNPLLEVKLHFTLSVAKILQTFILRFQTDSDKPISFLFLVSDEVNLVQDLLARFIDIW